MLGWLFGSSPSTPADWQKRDNEEAKAHKIILGRLQTEIAETQYLVNRSGRELEVIQHQQSLVEGQTALADTQTQVIQAGDKLSGSIKRLNSAQGKYRKAAHTSRMKHSKFLGLF